MSPMVEAPINNVMVWCSSLRCAAENPKRPGPTGPAHQFGLADALELALIRQQVHDGPGRFSPEQAGDGFAKADITLRQGPIGEHRRVEMPLRVRARADGSEERAAVGQGLALGESHDEGEVAFVAPFAREREPVPYSGKIPRRLPFREYRGLAERRAHQAGALGEDN